MADVYRVDDSFDQDFFEGASCAFGVFDGVHLGHRYLLDAAQATARKDGGKSVALTFDIDPDERFHPDRLRKLMTNGERIEMLAQTGVDAVAVLPFTPEFASKAPEEFLAQTFHGPLPAHLHVGHDFRFGVRASGSVEDLEAWSAATGVAVHAHHLLSDDGAPITATRIRLLLAEGKVRDAERLLGRRYFLTGRVEPGRGEGGELGFRTANLRVPEQMRALGEGVYAAYALLGGERYKAAVNVGVAATFADRSTANIEAHLVDFDGEIYGEELRLEFVDWLRPMRRFDDVDELVEVVKGNIDWVRRKL